MNRIQEVFGRTRVLLPVVHCIGFHQVRTAVATVVEQGADGVFLINQGGMYGHGVSCLVDVLVCNGTAPFVGVNRLDLPVVDAMKLRGRAGGLWVDDAGVRVIADDHDPIDTSYAEFVEHTRRRYLPTQLYFGGVAFKYQDEVPDRLLPDVARAAVRCGVDVVTTSGSRTGEPPTLEKLRTMREAIGDHALAVASGITPENVGSFLPLVNAFLVATGIEESFGVFDPVRVRDLAQAVHDGVV